VRLRPRPGMPAPVSDVGRFPCLEVQWAFCEHHGCWSAFMESMEVHAGVVCPGCSLATNDPLHGPYHKIITWNRAVSDKMWARRKKEWDATLAEHDRRTDRLPQDPQTSLGLNPTSHQGAYSR